MNDDIKNSSYFWECFTFILLKTLYSADSLFWKNTSEKHRDDIPEEEIVITLEFINYLSFLRDIHLRSR